MAGRIMHCNEPQFTMGVEEEYLLVDKETRALVADPPEAEAILTSASSEDQ